VLADYFCVRENASDVEKLFRFGIALQVALTMLMGLRFVVIDRADVLDKERRKMLTGLLLNSKLDQAIIPATSEEAPPSIVPKGVKFVNLESRHCSIRGGHNVCAESLAER